MLKIEDKGIVNISGVSESRTAPVAADIANRSEGQSLIIVATPVRAKRMALDLSFFSRKKIYVLPEEDEIFIKYEARNRDDSMARLAALKALRTGEDCIVVAPASAAVKHLPPHAVYDSASVTFERGGTVDPDDIKVKLAEMGYERVPLLDARGQFSVRGSIIDVFTPDAEYPYRVELFGDEVDSIRSFDPDTQRSIENLKRVDVFPAEQMTAGADLFARAADRVREAYGAYAKKLAKSAEKAGMAEGGAEEQRAINERIGRLEARRDELVEYITGGTNTQLLENYSHYFFDAPEHVWDYMMPGSRIMIDDPDRVTETLEARDRERRTDFEALLEKGLAVPDDAAMFPTVNDYTALYGRESLWLFTPFTKRIRGIGSYSAVYDLKSRQPAVFNGHIDMFENELRRYLKNDYKVTIVCESDERAENMKDFLDRAGLSGTVMIRQGGLTGGIEYPDEKICFIRDADIFGTQRRSVRKAKHRGKPINSFSDIRTGDYVVHENHGIGKFLGIEQVTVQGVRKDYIKIKYAGEDMLYVPVEQMDIVQKYIGGDDGVPKINRLSGTDWKKTKARAKAAIASMAKELLEVSAARKVEKGFAFGEDTLWQAEFEAGFGFTETDDQLRCIREIKADMEKPEAMDRLLCGDVGFGKTEVAARAMFKCVAAGKQAAVLVPTTLLANQHYYTLKDRFEKFPFTVEVLSRFRTDKQQDEIVRKLANGSVDVVIGTHRLLSKDVRFKDLGLLVIDEEQRFGVKDKEAIKMLRKNVDVLTLSATPIPRTLHMSLTGIKDMSLIEEPPEDRYPVQTYVLEEDRQTLRDVIERELGRGGQVYVVFNRVRGINKVAADIASLVPEARIAVGHGRMNERELENIMLEFINGETNVLVATTIIESGLDIPNVNTMVVLDADRFGLSQLYQLRGRVGRSNRMAYAYLMYKRDKVLSETAEKRLKAIRDFTEFGAGFKVAMRDLEIRGAGNILGREQHGHMLDVGYELYCKLVDDAVRALGGEVVNPDKEESSIELSVAACIPDLYIQDEALKLSIYKRIAQITCDEDEDDVRDELVDRFGDIPTETDQLIRVSRIRALCERLCVTRVHETETTRGGRAVTQVIFDFAEKNDLKPQKLSELIAIYGPRVMIHAGTRPFISYTLKGRSESDKLSEVTELLETL